MIVLKIFSNLQTEQVSPFLVVPLAEDHTTLLFLSRLCRHRHQGTECFQQRPVLLVHQHLLKISEDWNDSNQVTAIGAVDIATISLMKELTSETGWQFCFIHNIRSTESHPYCLLTQPERKSTCSVHHFKIDVNPVVIPSFIKLLWQLNPFSTISYLFLIFQTCYFTTWIFWSEESYLQMFLFRVIEVFVILIDKYQSVSYILHELGIFGNSPPTALSLQNLHNYNYNSTSCCLIWLSRWITFSNWRTVSLEQSASSDCFFNSLSNFSKSATQSLESLFFWHFEQAQAVSDTEEKTPSQSKQFKLPRLVSNSEQSLHLNNDIILLQALYNDD